MSLPHPIMCGRSVSGESILSIRSTPIRHPTPDLQSLQGAYKGNITRLERSAEEMSQDGSDLGEEIRKMHEAEKERDRSRQNSIQSSHQGDVVGVRPMRIGSRGSRSSTHANSIVDVNGSARWGGYSPAGFVTSPVGSATSGSWVLPRTASGRLASRYSQSVEAMQEDQPLDLSFSSRPTSQQFADHRRLSRQTSQTSQIRHQDTFSAPVDEPAHPLPSLPTLQTTIDDHADQLNELEPGPDRPPSTDTFREAEHAFKDFDGVHFSPDTDEYVELDKLGNEVRRVSARTSSGSLLDVASMLKAPEVRPISHAAPPPGQGMVYYPAPVPRMLNLPKRISQMPPTSVQAKKRSQMLDQLSPGVRDSAHWLSQANLTEVPHHSGSEPEPQQDPPAPFLNERMSRQTLGNVPPQLRATMFFEHQPVQHDVEVKSESAVATLDSILAASATAPVSAFTDHPFAGDVRKTVYAPEKIANRSSTALTAVAKTGKEREREKRVTRRRSSSIGNLLRRRSTDLEGGLKRSSSRASQLDDTGGSSGVIQRRRSQLSLGDDVERTAAPVRRSSGTMNETSAGLAGQAAYANLEEEEAASPDLGVNVNRESRESGADQIDVDFRDQAVQEDAEVEDVLYAQPTTLLAELQVRKAQQKSRSRTAATAFPNGMHSTLLELDAVEEINRRRRKNHRVALAWEDPDLRAIEAEKQADDEDVPLGVLFPSKDGMVNRKLGDSRDWSRPMGLMEKRELEDNEPLSSRRTRLMGLPPSMVEKRTTGLSQLHLAGQPDMNPDAPEAEEEEQNGDETLGQRQRRIKTKDALDNAISNVAPKDGQRPLSTFTEDVMSLFGGTVTKDNKDEEQRKSSNSTSLNRLTSATPASEEEETLGQRRARLQREREAGTGNTTEAATRPGLRTSQSMANILTTNPMGSHSSLAVAARDHAPVQGTLLHSSAQVQSRQRQELLNTNLRSSSYNLGKPLVNSQSVGQLDANGLLGAQTSRPANGGFAGGVYNQGGASGMGAYFSSPTANLGFGFPAQYQQQFYQPPGVVNPAAYSALNGGHMSFMAPSPGYPAAMGGFAFQQQAGLVNPMAVVGLGLGSAPLDPGQRDAIDRWRMSVAP